MPKPALPAADSEAPPQPQTADQVFGAEPVDSGWHAQTEREIQHRIPGAEVECRSTQCRVAVKSPKDLDALAGYAQNVLLTGPVADGKVRAIVRFER